MVSQPEALQMIRIILISSLAASFLLAMVLAQSNQKAKSSKKKFVPWSMLERDGKKLCPLCGEEYLPKDFTTLPPKLSLSEWHPNNLDVEYFEKKIADISDEELYNSINWGKNLNKGEKQGYAAAIQRLINKKAEEPDNNRYYGYSQYDEGAFAAADEYRELIRTDTAKFRSVINDAEDVLRYNIPYGNRLFTFEKRIDFNFNFGESGKYGFHYWGWGYYLTSAYILTGDKRYAGAFDAMFNQWYEQRNQISNTLPQFDVVWYELGIAARLPIFIDAFRLFRDCAELRPETRARMLRTLLGSGRWLAEALKRNPYHQYNWPIHTAISEVYLSLMFPEFKESREWFAAAKKVMEDHLTQDLYADGGYLERTPGYSYGVFSHFYRYLSLIEHFAHDRAYVRKHRRVLEKMVEFSMLTMSPLGTTCPFNDSFRSGVADFLYKHGNGFKRGDFLAPILPFLSPEKRARLTVKPIVPKVTSINLSDSRFAVMRSDWKDDAAMMIINYGPPANHHHFDILDFEIYANGKALAVDAGIGSKGYDDELHRSWYRATVAHNMVMVNDESIERGEAEGEDVVWATQKFTDYFAASHSGYKSKFGIAHRRHIAFVKPEYWVIHDRILSPNGGEKLDWLFHSPLTLEELPMGYVSKESPGVLLLAASRSGEIHKFKSEGMASLAGFPSEKEAFRKINYISLQKTASAKAEENSFGVLVFPFSERYPEIQFSRVDADPEVVGYQVKHGEREDQLFFSDGKNKKLGVGIESDAQFIFAQYEKGKLKRLSVVGGTFCRVDGKSILKERKRKSLERIY
jgi:hypothetical protein